MKAITIAKCLSTTEQRDINKRNIAQRGYCKMQSCTAFLKKKKICSFFACRNIDHYLVQKIVRSTDFYFLVRADGGKCHFRNLFVF